MTALTRKALRVGGSLAETERRDFWEICEDRYQTRSTSRTSQLPVARWHEQIGDPTATHGILDRLVHNAHRIEMRADSMRKQTCEPGAIALKRSVVLNGRRCSLKFGNPVLKTAFQLRLLTKKPAQKIAALGKPSLAIWWPFGFIGKLVENAVVELCKRGGLFRPALHP